MTNMQLHTRFRLAPILIPTLDQCENCHGVGNCPPPPPSSRLQTLILSENLFLISITVQTFKHFDI